MNWVLSLSMSIGILAVATAQPPGFSSAGEALDSWERLEETVAYRDVLAHAEAVRNLASKGNQAVVRRLVRIAENKSQSLDSREHAALVATQAADAAGAETVLAWVRDTSTELARAEANTDFADREAILRDNRWLINSFVTKGAENLLDDLQDHTLIATVSKETCLWACAFPGDALRLKSDAARLLARCKVPEAFRDEAIVEVIACDERTSPPEVLVELLGDRGRAILREQVRSGASDQLPFSVVVALTHLGDEEILPDLRAREAAMSTDTKPKKRGRMLNFIWRIEVQNPPEKLLEFIASTDRLGYRSWRTWAMGRAVALNVDSSRIREAILTNARNATTRVERTRVRVLKMVGLELGILQPDDLPDIKVRKRKKIRP